MVSNLRSKALARQSARTIRAHHTKTHEESLVLLSVMRVDRLLLFKPGSYPRISNPFRCYRGRENVSSPSLRTGLADLPHPALQLVVHLGKD